ncbi:MAG: ATP-binding protein [Spirochaetes bacterium]|nr:ATP-binding protein [Spirochaetota bacterium]
MEIERTLFPQLTAEMDRRFVSVLVGPRQVGKTHLLHALEREAAARGRSTAWFDLENPEHLPLFNRENRDVVSFLRSAADVVFLDEFHYLKDAGRLLKTLHDSRAGPKVYVSGSSSPAIHAHLKESLAGRYRLSIVHPLSFRDECDQVPGAAFADHLVWGGMPGLVHERTPADRMALLRDVVSAYLLKDVKSLVREENMRAFNSMLVLLAQAQGSVVSAANLAREIRLSEPSVARYLDILEATYVCHPVHSHSANLANELKKSRKHYFFDLGIRNMLLRDFSAVGSRGDRSSILESFVALAIIRALPPNAELRFWRTRSGSEVDFVLVKNRIPHPIEVKAGARTAEIPPGLRKFLAAYPEAPGAIVYTEGCAGTAECEGREVRFMDVSEAEACPFLTDT